MALYNIYAGLGGGFGGSTYQTSEEFDTIDEASTYAQELAIEEYESYGGLHGLSTFDSVRNELESDAIDSGDCPEDVDVSEYITDEMVSEAYTDDMSSWLCYYAVLASEDENGPDEEDEDEDLQ